MAVIFVGLLVYEFPPVVPCVQPKWQHRTPHFFSQVLVVFSLIISQSSNNVQPVHKFLFLFWCICHFWLAICMCILCNEYLFIFHFNARLGFQRLCPSSVDGCVEQREAGGDGAGDVRSAGFGESVRGECARVQAAARVPSWGAATQDALGLRLHRAHVNRRLENDAVARDQRRTDGHRLQPLQQEHQAPRQGGNISKR